MTQTPPAVPQRLKKLTLSMPTHMHEELSARAKQRAITVTELIRRAVELERFLTEDPDTELILRRPGSDRETLLKLL